MRHRLWHISLTHGFEMGVAIVWFLAGLSWAIDPSYAAIHSPVGHTLSWWSSLWAAGELVSSPLILYGIYDRDIRARGFGLAILSTALLGQGIAAILYSPSDPRSYTYWTFALFCGLKVLMLKRIYVDKYTYQM